MEKCLPDVLVLEETIINSDFKTMKINASGVLRNISGNKQLSLQLRPSIRDTFSLTPLLQTNSEKKEMDCSRIYQPPESNNIFLFFSDALDKCDDAIVIGDIKIDTLKRQDTG